MSEEKNLIMLLVVAGLIALIYFIYKAVQDNKREEELKEVSKEKKVIYYHIYMKDFSPLKHEIVLDKEKTLVYETYVNEQKNKTEKFALVYDENQEIFLNVVYKEKENDVLFQFAEGTYLKGPYLNPVSL